MSELSNTPSTRELIDDFNRRKSASTSKATPVTKTDHMPTYFTVPERPMRSTDASHDRKVTRSRRRIGLCGLLLASTVAGGFYVAPTVKQEIASTMVDSTSQVDCLTDSGCGIESVDIGEIKADGTSSDASAEDTSTTKSEVAITPANGGIITTDPVHFLSMNLKTAGPGKDGRERIKKTFDFASKVGPDIFLTQELAYEKQYRAFEHAFSGDYALYPFNPEQIDKTLINARTIAYDPIKYRVIKEKTLTFEYPRMGWKWKDKTSDAPVVLFEQIATGGLFYVINLHNAAFPQGAQERYETALLLRKQIEELALAGYPVIVGGDMNEHGPIVWHKGNVTLDKDPAKLAYNVLARDGFMTYGPDTVGGQGKAAIDQLYVTSKDGVFETYDRIVAGARAGTDHKDAVAASVELQAPSVVR